MRALLITPVLPAPTGNGLAMRAGMWLEALAREFDTDLAVAGLFPAPPSAEAYTSQHARSVLMLHGSRAGTAGAPRLVPCLSAHSSDALRACVAKADVVVVFRLYLAALGVPAREVGVPVVLDLDDLDWVREARLGDQVEAASYRAWADGVLDGHVIATTAAASDAHTVATMFPGQRCLHVPNGVRPAATRLAGSADPDVDLLFVATLGYAPNVDAAQWLVGDVLPLLPDVRVGLVGAAPAPSVLALAGPQVLVAADVPDVTPWYLRSRACVVPIRAGAGTRTKIPEAWAHGRPVITTTLGAEGIQLADAAVVADDGQSFAAACAQVLDDARLSERLVVAGRQQLAAHTIDHAIARALEAVHQALESAGTPPPSPPAPSIAAVTVLPERRADIEVTPTAGGYLARHAASDTVAWLNSTAYLVLELCTGRNDVADIARAVADAYDLPEPPTEVGLALGDLIAAGLVSPGGSPAVVPLLEIALWAPGASVPSDVLAATHNLLAQLREAGVGAGLSVDRHASVRAARNEAANRLLGGGASHVLLLDAAEGALQAAMDADVPRLLQSDHEAIGIPVPIGPVSWERAGNAARMLPSLDEARLDAYARWYDVSFGSSIEVSQIESGFVEGRHCGSGAMLLRRSALERMAGSGSVTRYRGAVVRGALTMGERWGFFDPGTTADAIDIDGDLAFGERLRTAGGQLMIALSGQLGLSVDVSRRLHEAGA